MGGRVLGRRAHGAVRARERDDKRRDRWHDRWHDRRRGGAAARRRGGAVAQRRGGGVALRRGGAAALRCAHLERCCPYHGALARVERLLGAVGVGDAKHERLLGEETLV